MNARRMAIGIGVALPIVGLLAYGLTVDPNRLQAPAPGRPAAEFTLEVMDSEPADTISLQDLRGELVVLNFWGSWCAGCSVEHADLVRAATVYGPKGVRFLGVLFMDEPSRGRAWLMQRGGQPYPTLLDDGSKIAIAYGIQGAPETFVIDREGTVVHRQFGPIDYLKLAGILDALVAGEPVLTAEAES